MATNSPKLLSINNYHYYRGGAETVFLEHNRMFEAIGWEVAPFAMHHPKNLETPWSKYFVDEIEFGEAYSLAQKVIRANKVIYSFEARRKLARLIDDFRPNVAHAHNIYHHISPSILGLLKSRNVPTVLTLHDLKIACPAYSMLSTDGICERCKGGRLHNVLVHKCIKGSTALSGVVMVEAMVHRLLGSYRRDVDRFVVPSRFYIEKLTQWGMPADLFRHVPNFADVSRHEPNYTPGKSFLYFGRLSREKGVPTLIRAAARTGCSVSVAGTGQQAAELQALAKELNANVTFLGYLAGSALHEAVKNASAIVLPSEWYENAPMSVLEAYAFGKPVLGARIGGIPELIRDGETGLTFESGNVDSLADALTRFMTLPDSTISEMGRRGRRWVETEFTANLYRERILEIYRELGVRVPVGAPLSVTL
jgi:glycosyltransferase involved in cell wall biosynthesis